MTDMKWAVQKQAEATEAAASGDFLRAINILLI
jgi:hypothetical protein